MHRRTSAGAPRRRGALRTLAGLLLVAAGALAVSPPAGAQRTMHPSADAYVNSDFPTTNYGKSGTLKADAQPVVNAYLRFDVKGFQAGKGAILRVFALNKSSSGFEVHPVANTSWGEKAITWSNAPPMGAAAVSSGPLEPNRWYTVDVSTLVTKNGLVSFALTSRSGASLSLSARESLRLPQLVVPAPPSPSPFVVTRDGAVYTARSSTTGTSYAGTLKTSVESAVYELNRLGGGRIVFSAGTFDFGADHFEFYDLRNIAFEGQGIDATIVRNSNGTPADTEPFDFVRSHRVSIRDLTVIAGGALRSTSDGIDFDQGVESVVERVKVAGSRGRGIVFDGKDVTATGGAAAANGNVLRDCVVDGVPGDGIELLAATDNRIEGCTITNAGGHGIQLVKSSPLADQPNKKPSRNLIRGNTIVGAGHDGINVSSGDANRLIGNTVLNSSRLVSSRDGIRIASVDSISCDDNVVAWNTATDDQSVKTQRYGLGIANATCNRTVVDSNSFDGNRVRPINDLGTGTIYTSTVDLTPPTAPATTTAKAIDYNRIDVTWTASTDASGVVAYEIFRDGDIIGTVSGSTLAFQDRTVEPSSAHSYSVVAVDAAGNRSSPSPGATATTPAGPTTQTVTSIADAYVNDAARATNYGRSTSLRIDGSPVQRSYIRFEVTGVVRPVLKATLRVYANSASAVGHNAYTVADNTWIENAMTFADAPSLGALLDSSGPFSGVGWVDVDVTAAIPGNGLYTFALTALSSTAISYGSRESDNPPELVVEVAP